MKLAIVRLTAVICLLIAWQLATANSSGIRRLTAPSPAAALAVIHRNGDTIAMYTLDTLVRVISGYVIGATIGIATALAMLYSPYVGTVLDSYVELIRPVPPIALTPFFLFWFGVGDTGQIILISMVSFLVFTVGLYEAGCAFEVRYLRAARALGARRIDILFRIILPGSLGNLAGSARVAVAGAISVTVAAEYLGAQGGLGYMIRNARVTLRPIPFWLPLFFLGSCHSRWTESRE